MKRRLDVLDGLRGFAIILVFLNHIDSHFIAEAVPPFFKPIIQFLFTSGNLGVTFFFILSGFLMGYLYKNPQPREFIERRYARIFPPFLVMVSCMMFFHLNPNTSLVLRIALMLSVATIARMIWIGVIERFHKGSLFISLFLLLQLLVAVWYGLIIMRHPPIWLDSLPFFVKQATIYASNATLTLSLGNYIPLLDGVYWSLAPEMIFYLLYPLLFAPATELLKKKRGIFVTLFILSLFPFFFGVSLLFKHSPGLPMLFIEYFIYFCGGICIANLVNKSEKLNTPSYIPYFVNPVTFISILFLSHQLLTVVSGNITIAIRLLLVFPFGFIVYSLIEHGSSLKNLFQHKIFLFLGMISYSMYIGHTAIVDGMHLVFKPTDVVTNILFLCITALIFFLVSVAMHFIIEKPYFQFKPEKKDAYSGFKYKNVSFAFLFTLLILIFFSSYTSQFNFFSTQVKYVSNVLADYKISSTPYIFSFASQENNMGVILIHLTNAVGEVTKNSTPFDPNKHQKFQIRMKEEGSPVWYASQDTAPAEIGESASYPFGFPTIVDSKNKTYIVEMSIKDIDYSSTVIFHKDKTYLTSVHQASKQELLKNPVKLLAHLNTKLSTAFADPEAQLVALCILPFFILLFSLIYVS